MSMSVTNEFAREWWEGRKEVGVRCGVGEHVVCCACQTIHERRTTGEVPRETLFPNNAMGRVTPLAEYCAVSLYGLLCPRPHSFQFSAIA
jgi:hypothetical protein